MNCFSFSQAKKKVISFVMTQYYSGFDKAKTFKTPTTQKWCKRTVHPCRGNTIIGQSKRKMNNNNKKAQDTYITYWYKIRLPVHTLMCFQNQSTATDACVAAKKCRNSSNIFYLHCFIRNLNPILVCNR